MEYSLILYFWEIFHARHHGEILRLVFGKEEMAAIINDGIRERITMFAKEQGFLYVTLDIEGYRTVSMNECVVSNNLENIHD